MPVIDTTYFKGTLNIDLSNEATQDELSLYIETIEKKYLKLLLGLETYADYLQHKSSSHYINLVNGEANPVSSGGLTIYYEGLKNMLANFTYYHYVTESQSVNTGIGDVSLESENGTKMLNKNKLIAAWNNAVDDYNLAIDYMEDSSRSANYPNLDWTELKYINSFGI